MTPLQIAGLCVYGVLSACVGAMAVAEYVDADREWWYKLACGIVIVITWPFILFLYCLG